MQILAKKEYLIAWPKKLFHVLSCIVHPSYLHYRCNEGPHIVTHQTIFAATPTFSILREPYYGFMIDEFVCAKYFWWFTKSTHFIWPIYTAMLKFAWWKNAPL